MKAAKGKIITGALILVVLAASYFWGGGYVRGDAPDANDPALTLANQESQQPGEGDLLEDPRSDGLEPAAPTEGAGEPDAPSPAAELPVSSTGDKGKEPDPAAEKPKDKSATQGQSAAPQDKGSKDAYLTEAVPAGKPLPVEPQKAETGETAYTATLSVRCHVLLDHLEDLDEEKRELVPEDGIILAPVEVKFYEGESVFNLLQREMKAHKIHLEFRNTPIYNSAYIRGIHNLYELDAGELSGWMFQVNDWFPNYGSSRYQLEDGDVVEWLYTLDLGRDIGGEYAGGAQI